MANDAKRSNVTIGLDPEVREKAQLLLDKKGISMNAFLRDAVQTFVTDTEQDQGTSDTSHGFFAMADRYPEWQQASQQRALINGVLNSVYADRFLYPVVSLVHLVMLVQGNIKAGTFDFKNKFYSLVSQRGQTGLTTQAVVNELLTHSDWVDRFGGNTGTGILVYWKKNRDDVPERYDLPDVKLDELLNANDRKSNSFDFRKLGFKQWLGLFKREDSRLNDLYTDFMDTYGHVSDKDQHPFASADDFADSLQTGWDASYAATETALGAYQAYLEDINRKPLAY